MSFPNGRLIVSDHHTYFDWIGAAIAARGCRFVIKESLRWAGCGQFYVDRFKPRVAVKDCDRIQAGFTLGKDIWCFPDGTFTGLNSSCEWKMGVIKRALKAGAVIDVYSFAKYKIFPHFVARYYPSQANQMAKHNMRRFMLRIQNEALGGKKHGS